MTHWTDILIDPPKKFVSSPIIIMFLHNLVGYFYSSSWICWIPVDTHESTIQSVQGPAGFWNQAVVITKKISWWTRSYLTVKTIPVKQKRCPRILRQFTCLLTSIIGVPAQKRLALIPKTKHSPRRRAKLTVIMSCKGNKRVLTKQTHPYRLL